MSFHLPGLKLLLAAACFCLATSVFAQPGPNPARELYENIKEFPLTGGSVAAKGLTLERDRAKMVFDGTFYFATPVNGRVTGAVFIGSGKFISEIPPSDFEKDNVKRLLGVDIIESDFKTAVLRFSDDTAERLGKPVTETISPDPQALRLAKEHDTRILKQTGANLAARIALSILNREDPGFFFATFDGGRRSRFSFVLDHQNRIPVANFRINGGEKGLIFTYKPDYYENEVWLAFYGERDYSQRTVAYSDVNDQIDIKHYEMLIDLRDHKKALRLSSKVASISRIANLRAVSFQIGESLSEFENNRLNKQMRLKQARLGGKDIAFTQEDWEGGFTVFLPSEAGVGETLDFEILLEGDFVADPEIVDFGRRMGGYSECDCHYPRSNTTWFPRHGDRDRATFDLTFWHPKKLNVASVGERVSEAAHPEAKDALVTTYRMNHPISFATFALAPFERFSQTVRFDQGGTGKPIPIEFNSLPGSRAAIKEDFILSEMDNSLRYFTTLFGEYPYPALRGAYHPYGFGQGLPSLLMIPRADRASKYTYVFIAHETAHQWWGDMVSWRSYRDQWLSEGFAEYSGVLYTEIRSGRGSRDELLSELRESLRQPPLSEINFGKGRLVDVGPIILGHRLSTRKTFGAYQTLIYNKGALVLRALHFLLTDPATGEGQGFFEMMKDFVTRYRDKSASTDDFRRVANEHFAKSPIGQKYKLNNLDWFFRQFVHRSDFPSYALEYQIQDQPDGKFLLSGTVKQDEAPADWFMVLPVMISFGEKQHARGTVHALGPSANFQIRLPARPTKVELDPERWVLANKISSKRVGN